MEQQAKQQRILGHVVGREISQEEISQVAGGSGGQVGTRPFGTYPDISYLDVEDDPTL